MLWLKHRHSLAASLLLCSHVFFADGCRGSGGASCPRAVSEHAATVRCSGAFAEPRGGAVVETGPSRRFVGRGHGLQTRGASPAMPMLDSLVLQVSYFFIFFFFFFSNTVLSDSTRLWLFQTSISFAISMPSLRSNLF